MESPLIIQYKKIDYNQSLYEDDVLNEKDEKNIDYISKLLISDSAFIEEKASIYRNLSSALSSLMLKDNDSIKEYFDNNRIFFEKETETNLFNLNYKVSIDSTDITDVNKANAVFDAMLTKRTPMFTWLLCHTDFDDGMSNGLIEEVESYIKRNKYVTITWLHSIYSQNQQNQNILAGLLRIIGMTIKTEDSDKLLTMVISGLTANSSKTQEAALMVIEEWRTKNCWDALKNRTFNSQWISNYAKIVEQELKKEIVNGN